MVVSDQETKMAGITINPGLIIDPMQFSPTGLTIDNSGTYYNGQYVDSSRCANTKMMETSWYSGVFRDNVQIRAVFRSDLSDKSLALYVMVHSRNAKTKEYVGVELLTIPYDNAMSPSTGTPAALIHTGSRATDYLQFSLLYDYKFEVLYAGEPGYRVNLDYLFVAFIPRGNILNAQEQGRFIDPVDSNISYEVEPLTITETCSFSIDIDTYGHGNTTFDRVQPENTIAINQCMGYYKRIDHVNIMLDYNATVMANNKLLTWMYSRTGLASDTTVVTAANGSYVPIIYITSNITSAITLTGTIQITGKVAPKDIPLEV